MIRILLSIIFLLAVSSADCATQASNKYNRIVDFGRWAQINDTDTRQILLTTQCTSPSLIRFNSKHKIISGVWICPYTGLTFTDPLDLDIEHIVPLSYAYDRGASLWTLHSRRAFANDPENLLVVSKSANRSKGSKSPLEWLPDRIEYRNTYVKSFVYICRKYLVDCPIDKLEEIIH
jgi:5-methylcytosine-specific restriction endonuclease McrA